MVSSLDDVWPMVQCFGKKWIGHSQDDLGTRETRIQHLHMHHTHTYTTHIHTIYIEERKGWRRRDTENGGEGTGPRH